MSNLVKVLSKLPHNKKWLRSRAIEIKKSPDGAKSWLKDLGKNDFEHAEAVEEYVAKILLESKVKLSPEEIYLILHSVYAHDVGYRISEKDHAKHTHDMITKNSDKFFIHDRNLAEAVALISLAHDIDDINMIPENFPIDFLNKTDEFDLRFLGALLRIADELDQGYLRVFNRIGEETSLRANVYHVEIGPQIIKLKTKPKTRDDWNNLKEITDYIQTQLDVIKEIISKRGIKLEQVSLYPTVWTKTRHPREEERTVDQVYHEYKGRVLCLMDRSLLGAEILEEFQTIYESAIVTPVDYELSIENPAPSQPYSTIVWVLGECFDKPLSKEFAKKLIKNTANGGGLVLFPFVAWSVSQGLNDKVEDLLPVKLFGLWAEGTKQEMSKFVQHDITHGIGPFIIENTYEKLVGKPETQCLIMDSKDNPFLTIGSFGKGRVAYLNVSSHYCFVPGYKMISPWKQSSELREIVIRTIKWVSG
ncbi:MAG: hypothetical protein ACFFCW_42170 [Candidatus Hodarchaeota archaeon]